MPTMIAKAVAAGAMISTIWLPNTMRLNTSRASRSPPNRNILCDAGSIAPGSESFMMAN